MGNSFQSSRPFRNIQWRAVYQGLAGRVFGTVPLSAIILPDTPCRIIRWGGDHADFVTAFGEPGRHFPRIFPIPVSSGAVVESVNQDSQTYLSSAAETVSCP